MLLSLGHGCLGNLFAFGHGRYNGLGKDAPSSRTWTLFSFGDGCSCFPYEDDSMHKMMAPPILLSAFYKEMPEHTALAIICALLKPLPVVREQGLEITWGCP